MNSLSEMARMGERLTGEFVVDAHTHIGPWFAFPIPRTDAKSMLTVMDRIGVDVAMVSGLPALSGSFAPGNDIALRAFRDHPDRFRAYAVAYPNHSEGRMSEIERCVAEGAIGVKVHSLHGKPYDHETYRDIFSFANDRSLPILAHTWGRQEVEKLSHAAKENPKAIFIAGHSGVLDVQAYCDAARETPNLYLETCTSMTHRGLIEKMCREVGPEKILFGSDMVFISQAQQIGRILFADLSDEAKRLILGGNAQRVLPGIAPSIP